LSHALSLASLNPIPNTCAPLQHHKQPSPLNLPLASSHAPK
jgi:hypothetical protein